MLARWMASGCNVTILREFRYLQTRTMLHLQDELRSLEEKLFRLDEADRLERPAMLRSVEGDADLCGNRGKLVEVIRAKWMTYGSGDALSPCSDNISSDGHGAAEFVLTASKVGQLERPSRVDLGNVQRFMDEFVPVVVEENFLIDEYDLRNVQQSGESASWLDEAIMSILTKYNYAPMRVSVPRWP
jgi:hypothetical protein